MSAAKATIIRARHDKENPYFQMRRATAQDSKLSWEARGMLSYLLSQPIDWEIKVDNLKQGCGEAKVYKIIDELKQAKYIKAREKYQDDKGHWHWTPYVVFETPFDDSLDEKIIPMPEQDTTIPHNPRHGEPFLGNEEIIQNKELQKKETETTFPQAVTRIEGLTSGKSSKPRKEDRLFNGIAFTAFDIDTRKEDYHQLLKTSKAGGRIGKITSALKKLSPAVTPEDVFAFFKYYKAKFPNADMPRDVDKYMEHFTSFRAQAPKPVIQYANNTSTLAQAELSETERAEALAAIQAAKQKQRVG